MKKKKLAAAFISFCLAMCLIAGSIDWSFLSADAQMEEELDDAPVETEVKIDAASEEAPVETDASETASESIDEIPEDVEVMAPPAEEASADDVQEEEVELMSFTFSDNEVTVTASCPSGIIPEDAELFAEKLPEDSEAYKNAYDKLAEAMDVDGGEIVFMPYDVYFMHNGERIEPDGSVLVSMEFAGGLPESFDDAGAPFSVHITEEGDVERPATEVTDSGVSFEVDSFSVMGVAALNVDDTAYAILYRDSTLVFQRGNMSDSSHGDILGKYTGFETESCENQTDVPWYSMRSFITKIEFKDTIRPVSTSYWFINCDSLQSADFSMLDTSAVIDMSYMFYGCITLTSLDLTGFNTSKVTDMNHMFGNCNKLTSADLTSFNTPKVTDMSYMFDRCNNLISLDLTSFDTSAVVDMNNMFDRCDKLMSLDLTSFNTSNVTNTFYMFNGCGMLTSLDLTSFNTSKVIDMSSMFNGCCKLTSLDLSGFNTSKVTDMSSMFTGCSELTSLDLSSFNTTNVTRMDRMFSGCSGLTSLDLSSFDTVNVTDMNSMFAGCGALTSLDLTSFNTSKVTNISCMFNDCKKLASLDLTSFNTANVTHMNGMFARCSAFASLDLTNFNTSKVTDMGSMFNGCKKLASLDLTSFNTSKVTEMGSMFRDCIGFTTLDFTGFDTSKVTNMAGMFNGCSGLTSLDLTSFSTSNVRDMSYMFNGCSGLTSLDLTSFSTSNVRDMEYMFYNCSRLASLDLSSFNTSKVIIMSYMFKGCSGLTSLDLSSFNTSNVTRMDYMFKGCSRLISLDLSSFNTSKVTRMEYMFNSCSGLTLLDLSSFNTSNVTNSSYMFDGCQNLAEIKITKGIAPKIFNYDVFRCKWLHVESNTLYPNFYAAADKPTGTYKRLISVNFNSIHYGTTSVDSYIGNTITDLPVPKDDGTRHFDGWFTEKTGGKELLPGGIIETATYYAHWTDYQYDLVLKPNGGDGEEQTIHLNYHDNYKLPGAVYSYEGKVFAGWNTRKDGSGKQYEPNDFVKGLSRDDNGTVILYAQWRDLEDKVTITFEANGGVAVPPMSVLRNAQVELPAASRAHYTFDNWSMDEEGKNPVARGSYTASEDVTLYAQWFKNPVITFDAQGMGAGTEIEVRYNSAVGSLPTYPTNEKRFCSLIGWFTEPEGGMRVTPEQVMREDTTLYAHWGWRPEFNTNGGKFTGTETYPMQEGSSLYTIEKLPQVSRDNYTFTGWKHGDEILADGCVVDLSENVEIMACWEQKETITVTFTSSGNSAAYTIFAGEPLEVFPSVSRPSESISGFGTVYADFAGWADASGKVYDPDDVFTEDTELTAQWVWKDVILTFNADGGSGVSGTGVTSNKMCAPSGSTLYTLPGAKKANYVLEGWYTEKNGTGEKLTTETVITESRTYYANWVSFFLNGSDTTSLYNYGVEWSNASNASMTNLDDTLEMHPTSTSTVTSSLHLRFEINKTVESSEDLVLPVGAVKIRVPKYIWKNWDGNNTGSNNLSSNLPKYPNVRNGMYFSYMEDGDDYILINSVELSGTAGLDLTISYSVSPATVPGGASDMNDRYMDGYDFYRGDVPVTFTIDSNLDGTMESEVTKNLAVEMHTTGTLRAAKTGNDPVWQWSSTWGEKPADADDYFYIPWTISTGTGGVQGFTSIRREETGYHDGTIVYQSGSSVVTKHPKSLLDGAPPEGITLRNTASVYGTLKSGCERSTLVTASRTVYAASYPTGEYTKRNVNSNYTVKTINGGQEDILDDNNEVELPWSLTYYGSSNTAPVWDENSGTYHTDERTIRIRDGVRGDVTYSSGSASAPYVWEPDTGNVILEDDDYYFSKITIYIKEYDSKVTDGVWDPVFENTDYAAQDGLDLYVRHAGSDDFVFYKHYDAQRNGYVVQFADTDITGFEIRHDSAYYATSVSIDARMKLRPTNHVRMLLREDVNIKKSSIIKNSSVCDIWKTDEGEGSKFFHAVDNTGGTTPANKNCYELNVSTTTQYTKKTTASQANTIFDVMRGTQDTPVYIGAYNYNNSGRKKSMCSGVFYDLLPEGCSVDPSTIFGIPITGNSSSFAGTPNSYDAYKTSSNRIDPGCFDVRFEQNWEDSGRTMMIITYGISDMDKTGMGFYYLLHNTYENVMERGTTVENDVAFVNTTKDRVPPNSISGALSTITEKGYYQGLENDNAGNIGYAKASTNYIPIDAYSWGFDKAVQTISEYEYHGEVLPNNLYTYRLVYSQSEYATSQDLVFFDILEGGSDTKAEDGTVEHNDSQWHGIFQYVNTGEASSKLSDGSTTVHLSPVIYYSTKDRASFTDTDYDVTKTETWTTEKPADNSKITAVAIDCSKNEDGTDFVMKGKQSLDMYITMRSPMDAENVGKTTYNEGVIWARHETDDAPTPQYDNAAVTIRDVDLTLHKEAAAPSGTEDVPADVYEDEELMYTLSTTNTSDKFTVNDIVIEDTVPEGLSVDHAGIKVYFDDPANALGIDTSPRVEMKKDGRKLTFIVSSLLPEETIHIVIPSIILIDDGTLTNTAVITSVNGIAKSVSSETTYHKANPTILGIKKAGVNGAGLAGAVLQLLDTEGNVLYEWVSTEAAEHFNVDPGDYVVHEVSAPEGYLVAEDMRVTLEKNGFIYVDGEHVSPAVIQDDYTKVHVDKKNVDGEDVIGALLEIYEIPESYGTDYSSLSEDIANRILEWPVYTWTSSGTKDLYGILKPGGTYALYEKEAPEGYQAAAPVAFTVNADGSEQTVTMVDAYVGRDISIHKYGAEAGNYLSGASMAVFAAKAHTHDYEELMEGTDIDWENTENGSAYQFLKDGNQWTSNNKGKGGSRATSTWTITLDADTEIKIPYRVSSESNYDKFTLKLDGAPIANAISGDKTETVYTATLTAGTHTLTAAYEKDGSVDKYSDSAYVILDGVHTMKPTGVWKCSVCGKEAASESDAVNEVVYEPIEGIEPIRWTSGEEAEVLSLGKGTYILREEAAPRGFMMHADIPFSVMQDGSVRYEEDGRIEDGVVMIDEAAPEPEEAELSVIKTVEGSMGDRTKEFHFKLTLTDAPAEIPYSKQQDGGEVVTGAIPLTDGAYEFALAHNDRIIFTIPSGTNYMVTELDGESDGYTVTSTHAEGVLLDTNIAVQFTNTKKRGIPTGFSAMTGAAVGIVVLAFTGIVALKRKRRK